jgi:putative transposase
MFLGGFGPVREAVVRRLLELEERAELATDQVRAAAESLGVAERTMWRWLAQARAGEGLNRRVRSDRFEIGDELRVRLAFWRGSVAAVHRELVEAAAAGGPAAPSRATLQRAVERDVLAGDRAGLAGGERARRAYDVFLKRPPSHRNEVWEADHFEAPVEVLVEGRLVKPWVTWFVDAGTDVVCGTAVTPGPPSRESILAALRAAVLVEDPYGPAGGLPGLVRIDRGKDFLSATVGSVLAGFAVRVVPLPAYRPHLKGSVETANGAVQRMFIAGLPRFTHAQRLANGQVVDPDAPALPFEAFVAELLGWVRWWNEHPMDALDGRSPLQAWLADPTPVTTVPAADLRLLTLEDDGRTRKITTKGVARNRRHYVGAWMTGQVGRAVRLRHMPHHEHEVEVFDATTGEHLGSATLADQATPEQIEQLRQARAERRRRLQADLKAAEKTRRQRYAAATSPEPARPVRAVTAAEAASELADLDDDRLPSVALPGLIPLGPPAPGWALPRRPGAGPATSPVHDKPVSEPAAGPVGEEPSDGSTGGN